jgi:hypothetical protein
MFAKTILLVLGYANIAASASVPHGSALTTTTTSRKAARASAGGRGLAYNDASYVDVALAAGDKFAWAYNWGSVSNGLTSAISYVPMLYCTDAQFTSDWTTNAEAAIAAGSTAVLSFNEPDIASSCGISPAEAAAAHQQYMNPLSGRVQIGAPAVSSSSASGAGLDYLQSWLAACGGSCDFDFCTGHWYGQGGSAGATEFLDYAQQLHSVCGKPVCITEFGVTSGDAEAFLESVLPSLDSLDFVQGYAYFYLGVGSLMASSTALSALGQIYASA